MKTECNIFHACNVFDSRWTNTCILEYIAKKFLSYNKANIARVNTAQCSHNDNGHKLTVASRYILVQYITALCRAGKNRRAREQRSQVIYELAQEIVRVCIYDLA